MDRDRYEGYDRGDSAGAVPGQVVRGLRELAHRQGRRCASDQQSGSCSTSSLTSGFNLDTPTQFSPCQARSFDDDDEGLGDDDDLCDPGAANESKMEHIVASCHRPWGNREMWSRS